METEMMLRIFTVCQGAQAELISDWWGTMKGGCNQEPIAGSWCYLRLALGAKNCTPLHA